ncbi:hypothetical protein QIS99_28095 [Streptomyces sp. B-S-A8]|uniref:Uncharacterized protein n=1 Tax=Streptomyces solicavernae TaxID=3043614 RepID=A0ABT6S0S2_9ACTN|nr:hypothetical protein [Streptomyces sp. B-S-A8]MDI3390024.1 hypothetical protein [Streptomyces sp. B-S-A8]
MTRRTTEQQRARELQRAEGISYHAALDRVREQNAVDTAPQDTTTEPAPAAPAVAYVLQPTEAEAAEGIVPEELGVRALPADASPVQRARAEAVWRTVDDPARPCRCSGTGCRHGEPCDDDSACGGRLVHVDRHPGSLWVVTHWFDVYACAACGDEFGMEVGLPDLPWGETQARENGQTSTIVYDGVRHPNFLDPDDIEEYETDLETDYYDHLNSNVHCEDCGAGSGSPYEECTCYEGFEDDGQECEAVPA